MILYRAYTSKCAPYTFSSKKACENMLIKFALNMSFGSINVYIYFGLNSLK